MAKLQYEMRTGKLVSAEDVQRTAFNTYRQYRDQLLNIPDRFAALVAAETDPKKVHEMLTAEILRVLPEFGGSCD